MENQDSYPNSSTLSGEIYHTYTASPEAPKPQKHIRKSVSKILTKLALVSALVGIILIIASFAPSLWYTVKSGGIEKISQLLKKTSETPYQNLNQKKIYVPPLDPKLPKENMIKIPSARIYTQIREATPENFEEALKKGVWRVSDFGVPTGREKPVILAAHRYGYLAWSVPYRLKNSFYSLPKLKVGDTVEIYWKQRKYVYEIYSEEKAETISDYQADLILYTCESLNSPVRIIKYARLLEI